MPSRKKEKRGKGKKEEEGRKPANDGGQIPGIGQLQITAPAAQLLGNIDPQKLHAYLTDVPIHQRHLQNLSLEEKKGDCDHGCPVPQTGAGDACADYARAYVKAAKDGVHTENPTAYGQGIPSFCVIGCHLHNNMGFEQMSEMSASESTKISQYIASIATDYLLLEGDDAFVGGLMAMDLTLAALFFEVKVDPDVHTGQALVKFAADQEHETLKFLHKRNKCNCLRRKMKLAKEKGVTSVCMHCTEIKDRKKELRLCSRCKTAAYCSKECQVANWPFHKEMCKRWSKK